MRNFEVRRIGKGPLLAAGQIKDDGTVEAFVAGQLVTADSLETFEARCAELSSSGVEVTYPST